MHRILPVFLDQIVADIGFFDLAELEVDRAVSVGGSAEVSVDFGAGLFGAIRVGRKLVAFGAGGADDPAGEFGAVLLVFDGVEGAFHEEM